MDDRTVWDVYFASISGWLFHPGSKMSSVDDAVKLTDEMPRS